MFVSSAKELKIWSSEGATSSHGYHHQHPHPHHHHHHQPQLVVEYAHSHHPAPIINSFAIRPDNAQIACVIGNSLVRLYDLDTRLHQDLADTRLPKSCAYDSSGRNLAVGNGNMPTIDVYDLKASTPLLRRKEIRVQPTNSVSDTFGINCLSWSKNDRFLAVGTTTGSLVLFNTLVNTFNSKLSPPPHAAAASSSSSSSSTSSTSSSSSSLSTTDSANSSGNTSANCANAVSAIKYSVLTPANLAAGYDDGSCRLWDTNKDVPLFTCHAHSSRCTSVLLSPMSAMFMVSGGLDGLITLYDTNTKKSIKSLASANGGVTCLDLFKNGSTLCVGTCDGYIQLYDLRTCHVICSYQAHQGIVTGVRYIEPIVTGAGAGAGGGNGSGMSLNLSSAVNRSSAATASSLSNGDLTRYSTTSLTDTHIANIDPPLPLEPPQQQASKQQQPVLQMKKSNSFGYQPQSQSQPQPQPQPHESNGSTNNGSNLVNIYSPEVNHHAAPVFATGASNARHLRGGGGGGGGGDQSPKYANLAAAAVEPPSTTTNTTNPNNNTNNNANGYESSFVLHNSNNTMNTPSLSVISSNNNNNNNNNNSSSSTLTNHSQKKLSNNFSASSSSLSTLVAPTPPPPSHLSSANSSTNVQLHSTVNQPNGHIASSRANKLQQQQRANGVNSPFDASEVNDASSMTSMRHQQPQQQQSKQQSSVGPSGSPVLHLANRPHVVISPPKHNTNALSSKTMAVNGGGNGALNGGDDLLATSDKPVTRSQLADTIDELRDELMCENFKFKAEMIREFMAVKREMIAAIQASSLNEQLIAEVARLKEENHRLKKLF